MRIGEVIKKLENGKYRLYSKSGRNLGTYDTRDGAEKREQQVQYFKHANEQNDIGLKTLFTNPNYTLVVDTPGELDWYKIGQHLPTLAQQDPREFGQSETDMTITVANAEELAKLKAVLKRMGILFKDISGSHEHPEIHSENITEWNLKQSDPLKVLDVLSTRRDNKEFPIRFYDGGIINVRPDQARRFMDAYFQMDDAEKDVIHTYIKTKKGFIQAIKSLKISEDQNPDVQENLDKFDPADPMASTVAVPGYGTMNMSTLMKNITSTIKKIGELRDDPVSYRRLNYELYDSGVLQSKLGALISAMDQLQAIKRQGGKRSVNIQRESRRVLEGYQIQLERDDDMYVLHIQDTKTGKRTEVRGKSGYETGGYDADDKLHQLLDRIGKTANISELINGEVVTINPKHPDAEKAKAATHRAFNEETGAEMLKIFRTMHHDTAKNKEMDAFIKSHEWELRDFTPDMFPTEEEFFDYDDPFDRVIDIDYSHRVNLSQPIIVGPQYSDGKYSVIDGNHRAATAQRMGKTIKGYFPVTKVTEALDQPYSYSWGVQDDYEWVARARTESGAILDIRFEYGDWDAAWDIEFTLDGGYKATAAGDQFRIFATVVKVIKEWWESTSTEGSPVQMIRFSADKLNNKTGKTGSREKLYNRFAQQFAKSIGFTLQRSDAGITTDFELVNPNYSKRKVNEAEGLGLTIFDIDETLMRTTAQIKVVKDGKTVRSLTNQEFNSYELQPGEEFDFGEFRNAEKFRRESEPIAPMIAKLKSILRNAGDSQVIMLTARADFDNKETFLDTFRDLGIDMSRVHVHRAGNLGGSPAQNKEVFIRQYLDTGKYARVRLYDDAMSNIKMFNQIAKDYPDIKFYPYLVTHDGNTKTVRENDPNKVVNELLNTQAKDAKWTMSGEDMSRMEFTASNGVVYEIDFLAPYIGPDEIYPTDFMPDMPKDQIERAVFVEFSQKGVTGQAKQGVAGTGAAAEVFGIVTNAILEFARKRKPSMLYFQAAEPNRQKLYAAIVNRLVKSMPGYTAKRISGKFAVYSNNIGENFADNRVKYAEPQFDVEWEEAERYPEFVKIGKAAWIELAKKGKAITITSANGINNTDAADPDSFKSLDTVKQSRALDQLKSGTVEMPIIAVYSDGWKELIGGNTRLTAMLAQNGRATVWAFKVPDEVAELAENFADGKVKGKSRPGRVKRAGASCNGSVTELRKRAKNSSGEKAKMYHWCANMKSGRKKS